MIPFIVILSETYDVGLAGISRIVQDSKHVAVI
jgi:hypothetical protein